MREVCGSIPRISILDFFWLLFSLLSLFFYFGFLPPPFLDFDIFFKKNIASSFSVRVVPAVHIFYFLTFFWLQTFQFFL